MHNDTPNPLWKKVVMIIAFVLIYVTIGVVIQHNEWITEPAWWTWLGLVFGMIGNDVIR